MNNASQHPPKPRNPAGYRPLPHAVFDRGTGNAAYISVAAVAGLGMAVGLVIAATSIHPKSAAVPPVSDSFHAHTSGLNTLSAAYAGPAPSLLSLVDNREMSIPTHPLLTPSSETSAGKSAAPHKKHGFHIPWFKKSGKHKTDAKRKDYVSPNPVEVAAAPTGLQRATAASATGPFFVGIEGDVTVADYDAATETIETYEGQTFKLDKDASQGNVIRWQDYPFNVHYRCDPTGGCTLMHHGAAEPAKRNG